MEKEGTDPKRCKQEDYSLESILECNLCMDLICEPISISCGHSFCRVCLAKRLFVVYVICYDRTFKV